MKMRIIKLFMLPIAAFALASAAAVSTDKSHESKEEVLMTGYIHNPSEFNCDPVDVDCVAGSGTACTYPGGWTVYALNGTICDAPLKKRV